LLAAVPAPAAVLVTLGAAAGACLPPISTAMRVDWGEQLGAGDRTAAYSLVYLVQEVALLAGPLLLAAVIAVASASAAVLVIAGITGVGALWFRSCAESLVPAAAERTTAKAPVLRSGGVRFLVLISVLLGVVIGAVEIAAPTLALAHRHPAASGLMIGAVSVGGIVGAAVYASRRWRCDPPVRLVVLLSCVSVAVVLAGLPAQLVLVGVLLLAAGLAINPSLTTISLLVDGHAPRTAAAEAFGWLSTGFAGGTGTGSAIAGAISPHGGTARPAFVVAALAASAAAAVAAAGRSRLGEPGSRIASWR
jgi:MFS family permease